MLTQSLIGIEIRNLVCSYEIIFAFSVLIIKEDIEKS